MTRWQKFAGTLASLMLASGIVLSATAPSLADMTTAKRPVAVVEEVKGKVIGRRVHGLCHARNGDQAWT